MATIAVSETLHVALRGLLVHERVIESTTANLFGRVSDHFPTRDLFADIRQTSSEHQAAIRERIRITPDDTPATEIPAPQNAPLEFADFHPIADSHCAIYSLLGEAVIRYSATQSISTRSADSWAVSDKGTTGHIARDHVQDYVAVMGRLVNLTHDAVIWELEKDELECRCVCPSCGVGVCLCAVAARGVLSTALAGALPRAAEAGIEVLRPRSGSAAESAGIVEGDRVVAIDGVAIDSIPPLQGAIRDHETGIIEFSVLRDGEQIGLTCKTT